MMRLIGAEVNRLRSRRITLVGLLAIFLALAAFQIIVNFQLTPPSAEAVAANQAAFEESKKEWAANHEMWEKECTDSGMSPSQCAIPAPTEQDYGLTPAAFNTVVNDSLTVSTYLVALALFMLAGSFIGAEFSSGSLANWLSFIPQRWRVFTSKIVTITAFGLLVCALAGALTIAAAAVLASIHGGDITDVGKLVNKALRGLAIGGILTVLGFCIGLITRHTAGAIGVLLGYLFVWFVRAAVLGGLGWAARLTPWTPEGNLAAVLNNGYTYFVPVEELTPEGVNYNTIERVVSATHGVVYWSVVLVVVVTLALVIFRRRDVN
jgi:ABC-2 type transport system permease protein